MFANELNLILVVQKFRTLIYKKIASRTEFNIQGLVNMNTNYAGTSFIRDQLGKIPGDVTRDFEFGALGSTLRVDIKPKKAVPPVQNSS